MSEAAINASAKEDRLTSTTFQEVRDFQAMKAFINRFTLGDEVVRLTILRKHFSGILPQGQKGYTEGVHNCVALAIRDRLVHVSPASFTRDMRVFFEGIEDGSLDRILLAGGAGSGKKDFAEARAVAQRKAREVIEVKPGKDESISIGIDPDNNLVEFARVDLKNPLKR